MNRAPFQTPPRWWSPKLSPWWFRLWRPLRLFIQRREQQLTEIDVRGLDHIRNALDQNQGVLITPNHSCHADAVSLYEAADRLGKPFYFMAAWQVLGNCSFIRSWILRQHGCFSVDREGTDMRAFRQAIDILQSQPYPLVIFPEGEVYHINDRITPFREGPAAIALSAAKRADRPIVCIPCALKFQYVEDPLPQLKKVMDQLEEHIYWRPRPDLPLTERVYRFAQGPVALKELEYLGHTQQGALPERIASLSDVILKNMEQAHRIKTDNATLPERIKALRQDAIKRLEELPKEKRQASPPAADLDDLFLVTQLFSYPGDYLAEQPTLERLAETLDKLEEDLLDRNTAQIRAARRAIVAFGEPIYVIRDPKDKQGPKKLTKTLEQRVQTLMDQHKPDPLPHLPVP